MTSAAKRMLSLILLGLCFGICSGCRSTDGPTEARFASVEIRGNTPGQIHDVAVAVFQNNGYQVAQANLETMIFEKPGTKWSNFAYGNWAGDDPVWFRVRAAIVPLSEANFRLQCTAYLIRDRGGVTEEEIKCYRSRPYQKLMNQVAAQLHQ